MTHRPKTAALIAYAGGLLSDEGRRRLEAHLAGCDVCGEELAAIEMYDSLIEDVRSSQMPAIDFESMELPLAREAAAISRTMLAQKERRSRAPWIGLGVAAAAAAIGIFVWSQRAETPAPTPAPIAEATEVVEPAPVEVPEPALLEPVVTLAAGDVHRVTEGGEMSLSLGDVLGEGDQLRSGDRSEIHVRLSDGTGIRLASSTETTLTRIREDEVRLELGAGALAHDVAPLASGSQFVVLAAGYSVEVTGTRFVVSYLADTVGVDLSEGSVRILAPDGEVIELRAPARWRSRGNAADGQPDAPAVRGLAEPRIAPTPVTLTDLRIVQWSVDGFEVETLGTVQIGLAPGEHEVRGWDPRGRLFTALLPVGDAPVELRAEALQPEAPRLRPGHLDEEDLRPVLTRGMRQVQRCYEVALRRGVENATGRAQIRLDIGVMGEVTRARVQGLPDGPLAQCITNYATRWTFPPPGGPVTIEQPLALTPTQ
ncbi:MAG: AgmX/PglI C-terminal domain-containing protein [Sandaracinaceae bacterium]|nr:AgmX/PglI C-terminal domain-containing protein [Sandaracinaceae bacterium]